MADEILKGLLQVFFLALGIAVAAIYIAKSLMLKGIRDWIDRKNRWIGYAMKCAFCLIGWASLLAIAAYRPQLFSYLFTDSNATANLIAAWFSLWGLATLFYRIFWPFLEKYAPKMRIKWAKHEERRNGHGH